MVHKTVYTTTRPATQANIHLILRPLLKTKSLHKGPGYAEGTKQLAPLTSSLIQPKLKISAPDEKYEQEADRVAERVMRMPDPAGVQVRTSPPQIQRLCPECEEALQRQPEKEEELLQAKPILGQTPASGINTVATIQSLRRGGQPLPAGERSFFESRFNKDFSQVRIHADSRAHQAAQSVQARAFTYGRDIVFNRSQYKPGNTAGRHLLAHELTHVVQQSTMQNRKGVHRDVSVLGIPHVQRAVTFEPSCDADPYLKCAIYEGIRDARRIVDLTISALDPVTAGRVSSGRIVDLLNVHFHVPTRDQIREIHRRFGRLKTALIAPPAFNCFPTGAPECSSEDERGVTGGRSTICRGGAIDICRMFNNFVCSTRSHVLIHELAHHELCTPGDIYAGLHPAQYMSLTNVQAMQNADSYAQFAEMVDMGAPICRECYLPRGPRPVGRE